MSNFKAGTAKVNITPFLGGPMAGYGARDHGSETIDDELYCKALVLSSGETKLAIITNDLVGVNNVFVGRTREMIKEATGIDENHILICASHTHFGPQVRHRQRDEDKNPVDEFDLAYAKVLQKKMVAVVQLADQNLQDAMIGAGKGYTDRLTFNRHTIKADGTAVTNYRMPEDKEGLTFGPIDPEVGVVRIDSADSKPIATLLNFACHPVCSVDRMYAISADYPGCAMKAIERELGGNCMFTLGCAGNMVPIEREGLSKVKIGMSLAGEAIQVWEWLSLTDSVELRAEQKMLELPLKNPTDDEKTREIEIQVLRVGEIGFVGLPGEIFVEIGTGIKEKSGIDNLFPVSLSNGSYGYFPISIAYDQGGYESNSTRFAKGTGETLIDEALELAKTCYASGK